MAAGLRCLVILCLTWYVTIVTCQKCLTVLNRSLNFKKANVGRACKFPFLYKDTWYDGCTEFSTKPGNHWCSTKVDKNGTHLKGNWGVCGKGCRNDGVFIEGDTACTGQKICMWRYQCPLYKKLISIQNAKSQEFQTLLAELKESLCNNDQQLKNKRICCENTATQKPVPTTRKPIPITRKPVPVTPMPLLDIDKTLPESCKKIEGDQSFPGTALPRGGQCGVQCNRLATVIGGEDAELGEFPWAALLGYTVITKVWNSETQTQQRKRSLGWKCGGTLINSWYVLTAAHCVQGRGTKHLKKVRLGELTVGSDPDCPKLDRKRDPRDLEGCLPRVQEIDVGKIIVHDDYENRNVEKKGLFFDIAMIRLKTEAVLNLAVQFACLPLYESEAAAMIRARNYLVGRNATVIGWGQIGNYVEGDYKSLGVSEKDLQKLNVPVVSHEECSQMFSEIGYHITEQHLCAGGQPGEDSCKGDSGGGLFIQSNVSTSQYSISPYVQIGVVSYGSRSCGDGVPAIYTRVAEFIQWIQEHLEP